MLLSHILANTFGIALSEAITLITGGKVYVDQIQRTDHKLEITRPSYVHVSRFGRMWVTM